MSGQTKAERQYAKGLNFYVDGKYEKAAKWYRKAAEKGLADAQLRLGVMYDKGHWIAHSYPEAANLYRKAADQGLANAQYNLGVMYFNGDGVEKDYTEAAKWLRLASDQGDSTAQAMLENMEVVNAVDRS